MEIVLTKGSDTQALYSPRMPSKRASFYKGSKTSAKKGLYYRVQTEGFTPPRVRSLASRRPATITARSALVRGAVPTAQQQLERQLWLARSERNTWLLLRTVLGDPLIGTAMLGQPSVSHPCCCCCYY